MKVCYTTIGFTIFELLYFPYCYMMIKLICDVDVTVNYHWGIYFLLGRIIFNVINFEFYAWYLGCNSTVFSLLFFCGFCLLYPLYALLLPLDERISFLKKH